MHEYEQDAILASVHTLKHATETNRIENQPYDYC